MSSMYCRNQSYNASLRIPRRIGSEKNEEVIRRSLPFVDYHTGIHKRLIVRDPISGLGDLPEEIDPLKGNRLRLLKENPLEPRDPIKLEGNLGPEYNCLYTTKTLSCRPRESRDIITLEGNLGEELDPIRPFGGGGKSRQCVPQGGKRDPIAGQGDFGREWDPIWKYEGRLRLNRLEEKKRDPITHAVPASNMGEKDQQPSYLKQFPEKNSQEDPITHTLNGSPIALTLRGSMRHYPNDPDHLDPITHMPESKSSMKPPESCNSNYGDGSEYNPLSRSSMRSSLRSFPQSRERRNPITHEVIWDSSGSSICPTEVDSQAMSSSTIQTKVRNPISGEGLEEEDYMDLWKTPDHYCFRNFITNTGLPCNIKKSPFSKVSGNRSTASKPVSKPPAGGGQ